jgi:hypothetical protein
VGRWSIDTGQSESVQTVCIPGGVLKADRTLVVAFSADDAASPADFRTGNDSEPRTIGLESLTLSPGTDEACSKG